MLPERASIQGPSLASDGATICDAKRADHYLETPYIGDADIGTEFFSTPASGTDQDVDSPETSQPAAYYDPVLKCLFVGTLSSADPAVIREASRWATGERGEPVTDLGELAGVDLSAFAIQALGLGARVLGLAAQSAETMHVQDAVRTAGEQVDAAVSRAAASADDGVQRATDAMTKAAVQAQEQLATQINRLVGGESPELADKLRPILHRVGTDLERQIIEGLGRASEAMREESGKRHEELVESVRALREQVARQAEIAAAVAGAKSGTTAKGTDYEDQINPVLSRIAAGLGDEYKETRNAVGLIQRNKKGDGVFVIAGGVARLVIEAHDGSKKDWGSYLDEAERNRGARVSIGVVRHIDDNGGHAVRVIAPRRAVVAFDPDRDSPELLRAVVILMRSIATSLGGETGTVDAAVATERISAALASLTALDESVHLTRVIKTHADTLAKKVTETAETMRRELDAAHDALGGVQKPPLEIVTETESVLPLDDDYGDDDETA